MRTLLVARLMALGVAVGLASACALIVPPPPNPFAGAWTTAERQQIAFRDNTVVINQANAPPTAMNAASCDGAFRFGYQHASRDTLIGLTPRQPDLRQKLITLLVRPDYPVAELSCGEGSSTYVLLDDRTLVAIHRDRDIAGVERLSRL